MMPVAFLKIDLDETWSAEDCGRELDRVPPFILVEGLHMAHDQMHAACRSRRRRWKRRPWCWHRLPGLVRAERDYCREVTRRANLITEVLQARAESEA